MKDFFIEIFDEMRYGGIGGFFIGLLMLAVIAFLALMIGAGIFWAVDSAYTPEVNGTGKIINYRFEPEHITPVTTSTGKVTVITMVHHDDAWYVTIQLENTQKTDEVQVTHEYYNDTKIHIDQEIYPVIKIKYSEGRISDGIYITDIIE